MITLKQIKEIANSIDNHKGYKYTGIRIQDSTLGATIGQPLNHRSNIWDDGEMTEEKLNGVCAVKVQKYSINRRDNYSGYEGDTIIILGSQKAKKGYDEGEIIMTDAIVLEIIEAE